MMSPDFSETEDSLELIPNKKSFLALKKNADHQGSAEIQHLVGVCFEYGKWASKSLKKAFHYYKQAADQGYAKSQVSLASLYVNDFGYDHNSDEAFRYAKLAADQGISDGIALLGKLYSKGQGVEKSIEKALYYYKLAADQENIKALSYLADAYENGNGVEKSEEKSLFYHRKKFEYYQKRANQGDPESQVAVGWLFKNGVGVEKSSELALHYCELSASQNNALGQYYLGEYYAQDNQNRKASEKAMHYFKLSADQGNILAKFSLAQYLLKNKKDEAKAVRYLQSILEKQPINFDFFSSCEYMLAKCFENGQGIKKSISDALHYYELSAECGNDLAQCRLGDALKKGELGRSISLEKAVDFYQLAADQKNIFALMALGECYEKGEGVEQSNIKAFHYYTLASDVALKDGLSLPLYKLAECYENGIGIDHSLEKALYYYKLAGENGLIDGYYRMSCCLKELGGEENLKKAEAYLKIVEAGKKIEIEESIAAMKSHHGFRSMQEIFFIDEKSIKQLEAGSDNIELILDFRKNNLISQGNLQAFNDGKFGYCNKENGTNEFKFSKEYIDLIQRCHREGKISKIILLRMSGREVIDVETGEDFFEESKKNINSLIVDDEHQHVCCEITPYFPGLKEGEKAFFVYLDNRSALLDNDKSLRIMPLLHFTPWRVNEDLLKEILHFQSLAVYVTSPEEKTAVYVTKKGAKRVIKEGIGGFCYQTYLPPEVFEGSDSEFKKELKSSPQNGVILIFAHERPIQIFSEEQYVSICKISNEIIHCTNQLGGNQNLDVGGIFSTLDDKVKKALSTMVIRNEKHILEYFYTSETQLASLEISSNILIAKAINKKNIDSIQKWEKIIDDSRLIVIFKDENKNKLMLSHHALKEKQMQNNSILIIEEENKYFIHRLSISYVPMEQENYEKICKKLDIYIRKQFFQA